VSYLDRLDFGFIADRELVPDVWDLADMHIAEIGRLFEATGAQWAQPPHPAAPRRGPITVAQTNPEPGWGCPHQAPGELGGGA
jgi:diacylglycerol O-acyltransferase / wax synthase